MKLLFAQVKELSPGEWRYTGHAIVLEADSPHAGAGDLIARLKKEGADRACRGALTYAVYEIGSKHGPIWYWLNVAEAEEGRFKGCLDEGVGSYYRAGRNER